MTWDSHVAGLQFTPSARRRRGSTLSTGADHVALAGGRARLQALPSQLEAPEATKRRIVQPMGTFGADLDIAPGREQNLYNRRRLEDRE